MLKTMEIPVIVFLFIMVLALAVVAYGLMVTIVATISGVPLELKNNLKAFIEKIRNRNKKEIVVSVNDREVLRLPYSKENRKAALNYMEGRPRTKITIEKVK